MIIIKLMGTLSILGFPTILIGESIDNDIVKGLGVLMIFSGILIAMLTFIWIF